MKKNTIRLSLIILLAATSSLLRAQYTFYGNISQSVLNNYMDKSISMAGLSDLTTVQNHPPTNTYAPAQRAEDLLLIKNTGAKFVGRLAGWWQNVWFGDPTQLPDYMANVAFNCSTLHVYDPDIICQGAIFEFVESQVNYIAIPQNVLTEFGVTGHGPNFVFSSMQFPAGQSYVYDGYGGVTLSPSDLYNVPDITQVESQMWFYFWATKYIDAGCEAIHFGQIEKMGIRDKSSGYHAWWTVLSKVRAYAATHARRHVVICDGHVPSSGIYYDPNPSSILPIHQRQLILDVHASGMTWARGAANRCTSTLQPIVLNDLLFLHTNVSRGGLHPQGWTCTENTCMFELDNSSIDVSGVGCGANPSWQIWGWDDISYFANQPNNGSQPYRNQLLAYVYYKMRCIDQNAHFEMPGRRGYSTWLSVGHTDGRLYRANNDPGTTPNPPYFGQESTIKSIWNGSYNMPNSWSHHDYTKDNVITPSPDPIKNGLVFAAGNSYYIGTDNRIHGYTQYYNTLATMSPSWSANSNGQPINTQVPAAGDLVASPDGTKLLYRGTDGLIYGYNIINAWTYTYFAFQGNAAMQQQGITVSSGLIYASNTRIYYIGHEMPANANRVDGFIYYNNQWTTCSASWAASGAGQNINSQAQAAGSLTLSPDKTRLYYRDVSGFIDYYNIINDWSYTYVALPTAPLISQTLRAAGDIVCSGNNQIYYVGYEQGNQVYRIHSFVYSGGQWSTVSPSWAASSHIPMGFISNASAGQRTLAVSPNGSNISYIGVDNRVHCFNVISTTDYTYYDIMRPLTNGAAVTDLMYTDNNTLYFTSTPGVSLSDGDVHVYKVEQPYCNNTAIAIAESQAKIQRAEEPEWIDPADQKDAFSCYPNPSTGVLHILLAGESTTQMEYNIYDVQGKSVRKGTVFPYTPQEVDMSDLSSGLYVVRLSGENSEVYTKKVSLQR